MLNKFIAILFVLILSISQAYALDVAQCEELSGHGYYPESEVVKAKDSGWVKDAITGGKTQLTVDENGEFDILFLDATKNIISAKADGAKIFFISEAKKDISFLVHFPSGIIEIYSFFQEASGKFKYSLFSLKNSNGTPIPKRSLMVGDCSFINFDKAHMTK